MIYIITFLWAVYILGIVNWYAKPIHGGMEAFKIMVVVGNILFGYLWLVIFFREVFK